jgi:hypothetical protein
VPHRDIGLFVRSYRIEIHGVVALLTVFYFTAAVAPWALVLFF